MMPKSCDIDDVSREEGWGDCELDSLAISRLTEVKLQLIVQHSPRPIRMILMILCSHL